MGFHLSVVGENLMNDPKKILSTERIVSVVSPQQFDKLDTTETDVVECNDRFSESNHSTGTDVALNTDSSIAENSSRRLRRFHYLFRLNLLGTIPARYRRRLIAEIIAQRSTSTVNANEQK